METTPFSIKRGHHLTEVREGLGQETKILLHVTENRTLPSIYRDGVTEANQRSTKNVRLIKSDSELLTPMFVMKFNHSRFGCQK